MRLLILALAFLPLSGCADIWSSMGSTTPPGEVTIRARNDPFPEAVTRCGSNYTSARVISVSPETEGGYASWRYECLK